MNYPTPFFRIVTSLVLSSLAACASVSNSNRQPSTVPGGGDIATRPWPNAPVYPAPGLPTPTRPFPEQPSATPVPAPASPGAAANPLSVVNRLLYDVTGDYKGAGINGGFAELLWQPLANAAYDLRYSMTFPGLGTTSMGSTGLVKNGILLPNRFYQKSRTENSAVFDRSAGVIRFSNNKAPIPLQNGAQDLASMLLSFTGMLSNNPNAFPAGTRFQMQGVNANSAPAWNIQVLRSEAVPLPTGKVSAIKIVAASSANNDYKLEMWYAPSMAYLPVSIIMSTADWTAEANLRQVAGAP